MHEVAVGEMPALRLAELAHGGPHGDVGATFGAPAEIAAESGPGRKTRGLVGGYHDDPRVTPAAGLRAHPGWCWSRARLCRSR